jgi:hypothetical protein
MKLSHFHLVGVSVALLLAFAPKVHADLIPWAYEWSRSPTDIHADAPGTGYISLTDEKHGSAVGDSDIVATNLKTVSTAIAANPDVFTAKSYALTLTLTDLTSGLSNSIIFSGFISGTLSSANSNLTNTYTGQTTQELVLGNTVFTTTIGAYTPPGPPGSSNLGSIGAHSTVKVSHITVETLPEPGTLVLSLLGFVAVGAGCRWLPRRGRRAIQ